MEQVNDRLYHQLDDIFYGKDRSELFEELMRIKFLIHSLSERSYSEDQCKKEAQDSINSLIERL